METISVIFRATDARVLDDSIKMVIAALPEKEFTSLGLTVLEAVVVDEERKLGRRLTIDAPTDKLVVRLSHIDVPHTVEISIR